MSTPDEYLAQVLKNIQTLHESILKQIAAFALKDASPVPGDTAAVSMYLQRRLAETNMLMTAVESLLAGAAIPEAAIQEFLTVAWDTGVLLADEDIKRTFNLDRSQLPRQSQAMAVLVRDTTNSVNRINLQLLRSTQDAYRTVIYTSVQEMGTGTVSLQQAVRKSVFDLATKGIGGFTDSAGRSWRPDSYAEMALRTAYTNASNTARVERYVERGHNLVIVSDAPRECSLCRPWEGKILALNPDLPMEGVQVAGTLDQARAAGLFHPRCRHSVNLYREGLTEAAPATAQPKEYDADQKRKAVRNKNRIALRQAAIARVTRDPAQKARALANIPESVPAPPPLFPPAR